MAGWVPTAACPYKPGLSAPDEPRFGAKGCEPRRSQRALRGPASIPGRANVRAPTDEFLSHRKPATRPSPFPPVASMVPVFAVDSVGGGAFTTGHQLNSVSVVSARGCQDKRRVCTYCLFSEQRNKRAASAIDSIRSTAVSERCMCVPHSCFLNSPCIRNLGVG